MTELPTGGTVRPITRWGEPVMHAPCRPVEVFGAELAELVADLAATMYAADGAGLAANQLGVDLAVFVFDCLDDDGERHVGAVCNPQLSVPEGRDRVLDDSEEGCLSLPGAFVPCPRADHATVIGVDHTGAPVRFAGNGLFARCLQHESDHLAGTVFGDRLPTRARKRLLREAAMVADDFPPGWPTPESR
ncbi:MAG: peptide deformylase [Nocardioidaceae bacterium]|nr:peptide deformylase [Nocardioidaceae bacterium]